MRERFSFLYGKDADQCYTRLKMLIGRYGVVPHPDKSSPDWSEKDSIMITYGDSILQDGTFPLHTLSLFLEQYLDDALGGVHILPFFPYSSDDGFSVIDYRTVRPDLGAWWHIEELSRRYRVMADLVINHVSSKSSWFNNFKKGIAPHNKYFIEVDPKADFSQVTRPRTSPIFTKVSSNSHEHYVWTTFSPDQVDVNFANPDVLFEYLDILLYYISKGVSVIRLDAIGYLWKELGTNCIHLPQTHEIVKLIRDLLEEVAPHVTLITETNVPHKENISYFGHGDEAHMVYQFSLPPLLLHALLFGNSTYLTQWAKNLETPPAYCYYFNFLASHDGIGVRPLEGLMPPSEIDLLVTKIKERGGLVSEKLNQDGTRSPYELNITYYDALKDDSNSSRNFHVQRFLCAYTIMMSLQGVPGIYLHSLTATPNDYDGVQLKGHNRAINRKQWRYEELVILLQDATSTNHQVFYELKRLLKIRAQQIAFHPEATQKIYSIDPALFIVERASNNNRQTILSISNVSKTNIDLNVDKHVLPLNGNRSYKNLITGKTITLFEGKLSIQPYETLWLEI